MVLRARSDGAAGSGRTMPPTVQAVVAARLDSLRHRLRDLARRASVFLYSFDRDELATVSDAEPEVRGLEDAEILVREDGARAKWRFRHETVREVAYASLPKRERRTLHEAIADALMESGHRSYAADHLERAALASLDLDPSDRRLPDRAADALILAATVRGDGSRAGPRSTSTRARCGWRARRRRGGSARRGPSPARARPTTGWASTRRPASPSSARWSSARSSTTRGPSLALRYQGDIAIDVDGDLERAEQLLADSLAAAGELDDAWAMSRSLLFAGWVPWTRGSRRRGGALGAGPEAGRGTRRHVGSGSARSRPCRSTSTTSSRRRRRG